MREAGVIPQPAQLEQVIHDAQIIRLAVGLEAVAAVPESQTVTELVHHRRSLRVMAPDRPPVGVVERSERHQRVAAEEVADARIRGRDVEIGIRVLTSRVRKAEVCAERIVNETVFFGHAKGMREQDVAEDVLAVAIEPSLAVGCGIAIALRRVAGVV